MKKIYHLHLIISVLVATALLSCTRNNGDIGPQFGTWQLDEIFIENAPVGTTDDGTDRREDITQHYSGVYFSFQGPIVRIRVQSGESSTNVFGNYEINGNNITFTFPDATFFNEESGLLGFSRVNNGTLITLSNSKFIFTIPNASNGTMARYTLTKFL